MCEPLLRLENVTKRFGMTTALQDMSLDIFSGEVHAIVGENGAGKSTIIKIMTGIHQTTEGRLVIDGTARNISGARAARDIGIAAIYQEPMVFPDLDVAENIFISARSGWFLNQAQLHAEAQRLLGRIGIALDSSSIASGLTLAAQQAVEIARALSQDVRILIMDEPTASLSAHEAKQLRKVARTLAEEGVAVIYISHRLEEIFDIADRVTVIRDGIHISTRPIGDVTSEGMVSEMVGRDVGNYFVKAPSTVTSNSLLRVEHLTREGIFSDISFDLMQGEVLCMAGLVGARRTDVALALFGINPSSSGQIFYKGRQINPSCAREAMDAGIAYVSEDRRKLGLAMPMSLRSNVSLATLRSFVGRWGFLDQSLERMTALEYRDRLNIRAPDVELSVGMLSGGNQQKTMLAKWLRMKPDVLIFDEPTRGIDIGAKAEVHALIREFVANGGGAIVISSDLPEVLAMGDRILVMREGRQMGIVNSTETGQETIMRLATGQASVEAA
ncbi:MAG: sugar ABC transporter ATP-binding protein [Rhodobacteraceae bacterium]|nr:sugar ABC transporter ATP-binding protein [Paracoccaceae bacterium]MCY4328209.1 sugar ABC transporter ATP-binding protein [Paracoccaceae bacterium]